MMDGSLETITIHWKQSPIVEEQGSRLDNRALSPDGITLFKILALIAAGLVAEYPRSDSMSPSSDVVLSRQQILVAMGLTSVILSGVSGVWMWVGGVSGIPFRVEGFALAQGCLLGLGLTLLSSLVYILWPDFRVAARSYMTMVVTPLRRVDLVLLGVLPGLSEEFLFRGVFLAALGLTPLVIIASSLVFGLLHLTSAEGWPYGLWATVLGIVLAISLVQTHNLLVPITAHIVANVLAGFYWKWHLGSY